MAGRHDIAAPDHCIFIGRRTELPDANIPAGPVKPYPRPRCYFAASQD